MSKHYRQHWILVCPEHGQIREMTEDYGQLLYVDMVTYGIRVTCPTCGAPMLLSKSRVEEAPT